jgi:hypothetical protein
MKFCCSLFLGRGNRGGKELVRGRVMYLEVLTSPEIQELRAAARVGEIHPVVALALADQPGQVGTNTEAAARGIATKNRPWLENLKGRLMDRTDFTSASSALGEIRAYGALLETWMSVTPQPVVPGKKVVPEFAVDAGDGPVIVEVHSRQLDKAEARAIVDHSEALQTIHKTNVQSAKAANIPGNVVTTGMLLVTPLGTPDANKMGDSVLTNAISRISSIKQNEKQIDETKPFVLWLDLQDPRVWHLPISEEQLAPLYTEDKEGQVCGGALWYALYGRKGDSIIETRGYDYRIINMLHDGRFAQVMKSHGGPTRISAVVYALPRATILMENPSPQYPLPPRFRASLLKAPHFRLDRSICEWEPGLVDARLVIERRGIAAAAVALAAFDPIG